MTDRTDTWLQWLFQSLFKKWSPGTDCVSFPSKCPGRLRVDDAMQKNEKKTHTRKSVSDGEPPHLPTCRWEILGLTRQLFWEVSVIQLLLIRLLVLFLNFFFLIPLRSQSITQLLKSIRPRQEQSCCVCLTSWRWRCLYIAIMGYDCRGKPGTWYRRKAEGTEETASRKTWRTMDLLAELTLAMKGEKQQPWLLSVKQRRTEQALDVGFLINTKWRQFKPRTI